MWTFVWKQMMIGHWWIPLTKQLKKQDIDQQRCQYREEIPLAIPRCTSPLMSQGLPSICVTASLEWVVAVSCLSQPRGWRSGRHTTISRIHNLIKRHSSSLQSYLFQSASSSENCIAIFAFIRIGNSVGQHNNGGAIGYRCVCRSPDGNVPFGFADSDVIPEESLQMVILFDMASSRSLSTVPMG
jgi:hypothetical protein